MNITAFNRLPQWSNIRSCQAIENWIKTVPTFVSQKYESLLGTRDCLVLNLYRCPMHLKVTFKVYIWGGLIPHQLLVAAG